MAIRSGRLRSLGRGSVMTGTCARAAGMYSATRFGRRKCQPRGWQLAGQAQVIAIEMRLIGAKVFGVSRPQGPWHAAGRAGAGTGLKPPYNRKPTQKRDG